MPRNLSSDMITALQAPILNSAIFVAATFASQTVSYVDWDWLRHVGFTDMAWCRWHNWLFHS